MTFSPFRLALATGAVVVVVLGSVWLYAQPQRATGTFGPTGAEPAYIVVNTPTPVVFTSQITDRQLKKRSVILVRLDGSGQPSDILGRLKDDGRNGDLKANDNTYSLRVTLNEATLGSVSFKVAARFKPGKWREPERDDDDWDRELSLFKQTTRDQPGRRQLLIRLLNRLARYTFSDAIMIDVWQALHFDDIGFSVKVPSQFDSAIQGEEKVVFFQNTESASDPFPPAFVIDADSLLQNQTVSDYALSLGANDSSIENVTIANRQYVRWQEDLGGGQITSFYSTLLSSTEVLTIGTMSSTFATSAEFMDIVASLEF